MVGCANMRAVVLLVALFAAPAAAGQNYDAPPVVTAQRQGDGGVARFVIVVLLLIGAFEVLFATVLVSSSAFRAYLAWSARVCATLLGPLGHEIHVEGARMVGRATLVVSPGCDGWQTAAMYCAALLGYPASWPQRAWGILAGSLVPALAQDSKDRTVEQFSCKDIMRESGANRDVAIAFLRGFFLGKSGNTKFNLDVLHKQSDDFIEHCLSNPNEKAMDAMARIIG